MNFPPHIQIKLKREVQSREGVLNQKYKFFVLGLNLSKPDDTPPSTLLGSIFLGWVLELINTSKSH